MRPIGVADPGTPDRPVYDTPSDVTAADGIVSIAGPDHVALMMTPDAAIETSDRLLQGAMKARGQEHFADMKKR